MCWLGLNRCSSIWLSPLRSLRRAAVLAVRHRNRFALESIPIIENLNGRRSWPFLEVRARLRLRSSRLELRPTTCSRPRPGANALGRRNSSMSSHFLRRFAAAAVLRTTSTIALISVALQPLNPLPTHLAACPSVMTRPPYRTNFELFFERFEAISTCPRGILWLGS